LQLDANGKLVTRDGHVVNGEHDPEGGSIGPIIVPSGVTTISVASDGTVTADGTDIGRLRIVSPRSADTITHEAGGLFAVSAPPLRTGAEQRAVRQGALEASNVTPVEALVDMIDVQRLYASAQRALSALDSARAVSVSELAKPL
jgi:flagellar basal body rod protein FlgG